MYKIYGKMDKTEMIDGFVRYSIEQNQENRLDKKIDIIDK